MRQSIFFKIFSGFCLTVVLLSLLIFSFSFQTIRRHYMDTLSLHLERLARVLYVNILPMVEKGDFQRLDPLVKKLGRETGARFTIIAPDGRVLADSEREPRQMENHKNRPEIRQAIEKGIGRSLRFSTTMDEKMLYVAVPIRSGQMPLGVLRVSLFLRDIDRLLGELRVRILGIVLFMALLSLLVAYFLTRNLSYPLRKLAISSKTLSLGDFSARVDLDRNDEIGQLAVTFNEMAEKLEKLFDSLRLKQEEVNSIVSSLEEALLVIDKEGRITLFNESFGKLSRINPQGRFWWEVLRSPHIGQLIEEAKEKGRLSPQEVEWRGRTFLCSFVFLPSKGEMIIVLHDITEFKKLEKIKKDFVVNVSHELRTPLTAIKGYVETMREEVCGQAGEYLEVIQRHTDRLINIVNDLLSLSGLEEKGLSRIEKVDLEDVVNEILKIFSPRAEEKGLRLEVVCKGKAIVRGDRFKLEQMFINLIDNAIKYTEEGKVLVSLSCLEKEVVIKVKDTGVGISGEHLDRVFERFYVVDKARSRKVGGTGLGLSIVKHIVLLHGGNIKAYSSLGKGTEFAITFPVNS